MSEIELYLQNNAGHAARFEGAGLPPAPEGKIAILACMDTRLELGSMIGLAAGQAHVIRNAGGVVTEDVIRSLAVSQNVLGTRQVMVIQHTQCGMMAASDQPLKERIEAASGVRPDFSLHTFPELEESVRQSMAALSSSPFLTRTGTIRGFVYDVDTGELREVT